MGHSIPTRSNAKMGTKRTPKPNKLYETGYDLTSKIARPQRSSHSHASYVALCATKKADPDDDDDDSDEESDADSPLPEAEPIPTPNNRTGFYGVTCRDHRAKKPYQVRVRSGDQMLSLGSFATLEKAARVAAGFSERRLELHADDPVMVRRLEKKRRLEHAKTLERAEPIVNKHNTVGYWGVHLRRDRRKGTVFDARFREGGRHLYLGSYSTKEEAGSVAAGYLAYRKRNPLPDAPAVKRGPRKRRSCVLDDNEAVWSPQEAPATEGRTMTTRANGRRKPATYVSEPSESSESSESDESASPPPSPKSSPPPSPKSSPQAPPTPPTPPTPPRPTPKPRTGASAGGTCTHWTEEATEALRVAVKRQFAEGVAGKSAHGGAMCGRGRPNWTKIARELGFENPNIAARRCYRRWLAIDPSNKEAYARERERSRARYLRHKAKILLDNQRRRRGPKPGVVGLDDLFAEDPGDNDHEIPVADLADLTEFDNLEKFDDLGDLPDEFDTLDTLFDDASETSSNNDLYCTDETMSDIDAADEKRGSVTIQTVSHIPRSSYKSVVGTPLTLFYTFQPTNLGVRFTFEQTRLCARLAELARKDAIDAAKDAKQRLAVSATASRIDRDTSSRTHSDTESGVASHRASSSASGVARKGGAVGSCSSSTNGQPGSAVDAGADGLVRENLQESRGDGVVGQAASAGSVGCAASASSRL